MTKEELKGRCAALIDENRDRIIALGEDIFAHPELGFKEERTSALVRETLDSLHIPHQDHLALTGVKGSLKGRESGPRVKVMG